MAAAHAAISFRAATSWSQAYGDGVENLVPAEYPHDVAVDPQGGRIYWTEGIQSGMGMTAAIGSATVDGFDVQYPLTGLSVGIRGIAVDTVNDKIYWTEHVDDEIWWADLDGSNAEVAIDGLTNPHDVAVDAANGRLCWTEGIGPGLGATGKIRSVPLGVFPPVSIQDVHTGLSEQLRDLTVVTHRRLFIFEDGFESGDTSSWSNTVGSP
jgi:DNA-binding beta-propeller fold protein YncE